MNKNKSAKYEQIDIPSRVGGLIINSNNQIALVSRNRPTQEKITKQIPTASLLHAQKSKMETLLETLSEEYNIRRNDIIATYHRPFKEYYILEEQSNATMTLYTLLIDHDNNASDSLDWVSLPEFTNYVDNGLVVDTGTLFAYEHYIYDFNEEPE